MAEHGVLLREYALRFGFVQGVDRPLPNASRLA
ncbi:hypothetical protein SRABI70_00263 [Pseudomonas sp. Bi70]|nr:hypothetical protein SRABI70_00263 [Pseudomonas sp. Bi70]